MTKEFKTSDINLKIKAKEIDVEIKKIFSKDGRKFVEVECTQGHLYSQRVDRFIESSECKFCKTRKVYVPKSKFSYEYVKSFVEKEGYILLSKEYKNKDSIIYMRCPNGHDYKASFGNFKSNYRCAKCIKTTNYTYEYVRDTYSQRGHTLLSKEYLNNITPMEVECPNGHIYLSKFSYFKNLHKGCPYCFSSKGENKIKLFLEKHSIDFNAQYKFENCKDINPLPFDFYLTEYNLCIEYDGKQHFEPINRFGGQRGFEDRKRKDEIKNVYCRENNIKLLRMPYWEFDSIDEILKNQLFL